MAPRKVRLVIDAVRGVQVEEALTRLNFLNRSAALPVLKLLKSAIANAEHNFSLPKEKLFVKTITADGGPTLHRWRARAMGRAAPIRKRTTHISLVLEMRDTPVTSKAAAKKKRSVNVKQIKTS